ncbi:aminotransferase class V-fold PLP-dependent enzyme [Paraburkholderia sp.]|uniref:aminotransferase class V-fold PLP-dependent enzyme n=1 Tax=Paraburkholderia sp. TaxID=1926495 RepID=UPI00238C332E|nr:aminotransferase class V-fold PLP-dependent enzyme [Paraburkholderia sp.]MDE1181876.1 aminotransferase class V-fold PLP-dependent enzyme [Paraburkholderia sp.]
MTEHRSGAAPTFRRDGTFLDAAYMHPVSIESGDAMRDYLRFREGDRAAAELLMTQSRSTAVAAFARLMRCDPASLGWIPSTMVGENLVVNGLGIAPGRGRVVTDAYHFNGSLFMYDQMRQAGADVQVVMPRGQRIELADFDAAITPGTTLVAVSLVSATTGFVHDLKALCDLAHARGALVYADLIQAAGAMPVDLTASGVDFCASSTYKWLMGDFGVGFFYARAESLARLARTQTGYRQMAAYQTHFLPHDAAGACAVSSERGTSVAAHVEVGTLGNAAIAGLACSLTMLEATDLAALQTRRRPMFERLAERLPALGFAPMTAPDTPGPIVAYACENAGRFREALAQRTIRIGLYQNRIRISPSFYNTMDDIDALIDALGAASGDAAGHTASKAHS